jgi:tRNA pseudouridine55 synthase
MFSYMNYVLNKNIVLVNKPSGWTSFDVVKKFKFKLNLKKIGHAGTLDPMATGLLILLLNNETKNFADFQNYEKEYIATISFGVETDTYDALGCETFKFNGDFSLNKEEIKKLLSSLVGKNIQTPPKFSRVKVSGKRAYEIARKGISFSVPEREVYIYKAELINILSKEIKVLFSVSSGTYIRSIAYDLGKKTGFGAHLSGLCRTKIGPYKLEDAVNL